MSLSTPKNYHILLVEDEEDIRELIKIQLELDHYMVTAVSNGKSAIEEIQLHSYDLVVLDRMIPDVSGLEVLKFIRHFKETAHLPVLIITALSRSEDIVTGLESGADDYITKPFEMTILLARTKALLRRGQSHHKISKGNVKIIGNIVIDSDLCKVKRGKEILSLTPSEYRILTHLSENNHRVLTRQQLVTAIQGDDIFITERTIDTHISSLRKKMGSDSHLIETIRGVGYRIGE